MILQCLNHDVNNAQCTINYLKRQQGEGMSNADQNEQLKQLSVQLQLKISRLILNNGIIFFTLFCLIQLATVFSTFNSLIKSEFSFLKSIGSDLTLSKNRDKKNLLNFLDSSAKILKYANIDNNTNLVCNEEYYLCEGLNITNFAPYDSITRYLSANRHLLAESSINSISIFNQADKIFLNLSQFGVKSAPLQSSTRETIINNVNQTTITPNYYKFVSVGVNESLDLDIICSSIHLDQYNLTLCISYLQVLTSTIGLTDNFFFIESEDSYFNQTDINRVKQILTNNLGQFTQARIDEIATCLQSFPIQMGKYMNKTQGLQIKCRNNKGYLLNIFGPTTALVSYEYQIDLQAGIAKYLDIFQQKKIQSTIYVSSNSSFYKQQQDIVVESLTQIRQTGFIMMVGFGFSIFVLQYFNHIIRDIFLKSVDIITTLCEFLKNKEEKQFNRHLLRGHPEILKFLVTYFYQFMWIHKLRKFKGKYVYKKLLLEGLELFQEEKYGSVLKFIYLELISIQSQLVQKLFKIKQLPHKKRQMGSKCQEQQQKIHNPVTVNEQRVTKRRNANFNLLNPDDDELMKNISISYRGNRGVRFSNDIQTIEIDEGPILRKAKFTEKPMVSCQTIKNDLSQVENESIKRSDFNKDSLKSLKSEEESFTSLIDVSRGIKKKDSSNKTRSLQSIHADLDNLKLDEQLEDDELLIDQQSEQDDIYNMNREQITIMISETYQKVIDYYQKLLDLLANKIEGQPIEEVPELVSNIYVLTIRKYEKVHELLLYQSQNEMEKEYREIIDFQDLKKIERNFNHYLSNELTQQAEVLKESILQAQRSPISLSTLQDVYCKSSIKKIRIAARHLLARAAQELQPHLDLVIAKNVYANLKEEKTTSTVKQESLTIFMRNLERYTNFWQELEELKMATQFYNTKNKKFYFLVSIPSIKVFTPVLSKFYDLLDNFDIFNLYNLEEDTEDGNQNQTNQNIIMKTRKRCMSDKLKYLMDLQSFIDQFNFTPDKLKEQHDKTNSVKTIIKKLIYEKQFHEILLTIESDEVDYSKYVVIFLGDQHNALSSGQTEESSSSANHRPYQQKIHLQVTKIIEKGYLHLILVGFSLDLYPSKYGRLKRYVKLSPELFEVELGSKEQPENLRRLEKYLR